ncbi:MAG: hypothetical protein V4598_01300 [Bdellovibrionota bacterium]
MLYAQSAVDDVPLAISVISSEQLVIPVSRFVLRQGGRAWTASEQSAGGINDSFSLWMRCENTPNDPECSTCETGAPGENIVVLDNVLNTVCLPQQSDAVVAFSPLLTADQKNVRDTRICNCFMSGRAGFLEGYSYAQAEQNNNLSITNFGTDEDARSLIQRGASRIATTVRRAADSVRSGAESLTRSQDSNFQRVRQKILNERALTVFSATSYTRTSADTAELGGRYSVSPPAQIAPIFAGNPMAVMGSIVATQMNQAIASADSADLNASILNSANLPANFCVPYRNFLASKQFPSEAAFYSDLRGTSSFNEADWNYSTLVDSFRRMKGDRDDEVLFRENPEAERIHRRLEFLHNNPVLKNIFQSGNVEQMRRAFTQVKKMPEPCTGLVCSRNPEWVARMNTYRGEMLGLLREQPMIDAAQAGSARARNLILSLENIRGGSLQSSDELIGAGASSDASRWGAFCQARDRLGAVKIFDVLEGQFGIRNAVNPVEDKEFEKMNIRMCQSPRRNPRTRQQMKFTDFFNSVCTRPTDPQKCTPDNRSQLVAEFVATYSEPEVGDDSEEVSQLLPYIEAGEMRIGTVADSDIQNLNSISRSPERRRRQFALAEGNGPQNNRSQIAPVAGRPDPNAAAAVSAAAALANGGQNPNSPAADQVFVPQGRAAEVTPETVATARAELSEGETEAKGIRDEISNLRDVMRKETQTAGGNSPALTDLNQRLASLERRLATKERENADLQRQIEETENRNTPQRTQVASGSGDQRRGSSAAVVSAQGGSTSGANPSGGASGGGAQLNQGSVSGRTAGGSSRAVISSGNAALLSKYGVQSGTVQGALIVANPNEVIDYSSLRSQSEGSILPLTMTAEEFNLISGNDQSALNRYLDQVRAMPGNVVRLNITSAGQQLELFVLKNGNQISIIPSASAAGRSPASERAPVGREFTLGNLRNELGN